MNRNKKPYKLGIALSGGGARGFAHAGALQALNEAGLKPDVIAGVSAGAVICALYASGIEPRAITSLFNEVKFSAVCEFSMKNGGFFKMTRFEKFLQKTLGNIRLIEELKIPTYICATDIDNGLAVAFNSGNLTKSVVASASIPILFQPVRIDGVNYVDGGVLHNLPAWAISGKCEKLIGINCSPLVHQKRKDSLIDVAHRTYSLMAKNNALHDMALCDLVIETKDIAHHRVFSMKEIERVYQSGYEAAMTALKQNNWI